MMTVDYQEGEFSFCLDSLNNDQEAIRYYCKTNLRDSEHPLSDYGLLWMKSPYYKAALDYKEVRVKKVSSTLGWIIPICLLEEDEELNVQLEGCCAIAVKKMLLEAKQNNILPTDTQCVVLSELFGDDWFLFVYRYSVVPIDDIKKYYPSLYNYGFYITDGPKTNNQCLYKSDVVNNIIDDTKKITLYELKEYTNTKTYIDALYAEILPYTLNPFLRFIALYQVIEILMDMAISKGVIDYSLKYQAQEIDKNTFRDKIGGLNKESEKINAITGISDIECKTDFIELAKDIFGKMGIDCSTFVTYGDYMYKVRNCIVHDLRKILPYIESVTVLVEYYERNIYSILKRTNFVEDYKSLYIIDCNNKDKETVMNEFKAYIESHGLFI